MNFVLVGLLVSLVFAGITFIATQNIFSSILIFLFYTLFFVLIVRRLVNKSQLKVHRYHECYQFINSFIISLNIKESLNAAMESAYETSSSDTKEILDSIKDLNEEEKISYLNKYFKFDIYHLFNDTISLWNEQGGDIIEMSHYLVEQARLKEEYLITCQRINKNKTTEFIILWSIALAILVALRFALSQFFARISQTLFYQIAIVSVVLFVLVSIFILVKRATKLSLEGWSDDEK